ncbi:MAG: phosphoribosyl-AMP cyclohydrolase [Candidatus Saccharibacteria bacterium]|nr:phosphoribosyl-AMP cyclohydrolase [Candidatus Saccharibacteria bacterium]
MYREIENIEGIRFNITGYEVPLAPVTVVDSRITSAIGGILMMAFVDAEALQMTLDNGIATYWSRSRSGLWIKGESSGNIQLVRAVFTDCDSDALIFDVIAPEASCHNGTFSCFKVK